MGLIDKLVKPNEKTKLLKEISLNSTDIEFILLSIKNSMISGAQLEQAVATITKLQKLYTTLAELQKKQKK